MRSQLVRESASLVDAANPPRAASTSASRSIAPANAAASIFTGAWESTGSPQRAHVFRLSASGTS